MNEILVNKLINFIVLLASCNTFQVVPYLSKYILLIYKQVAKQKTANIIKDTLGIRKNLQNYGENICNDFNYLKKIYEQKKQTKILWTL